MQKELGKITRAEFGFGGYQECEFGLWLTLSGKSWGVTAKISGGWMHSMKPDKDTKWTEESRAKDYAEMATAISDLLTTAKIQSISQLIGLPVEATFDGLTLQSWRILTEVL